MARETVPTGHFYKRHLVPPSQRPELLRLLGKKLSEPAFFKKLPLLCSGVVKRFDFHFSLNGQEQVVPVAIKDTSWPMQTLHGSEFEEIRNVFLAYQKAVRNGGIVPKACILRSSKVYGFIGRFLVMEYIAQVSLPEEFWASIESELRANLSRLKIKTGIMRAAGLAVVPQVDHMMTVANTNSGNPKNGKWIIFLPYDYA